MVIKDVLIYISLAWSILLTGIVVWFYIIYKKITKGVKKGDFIRILESVHDKEKLNAKEISEIKKKIEKIEYDALKHVQNVALRRFNPFNEMGGDQSFSLAILDGKNSGLIITGLHTRERTRVYVKNIEKGKCEIDLSQEEQKVLKSILVKK